MKTDRRYPVGAENDPLSDSVHFRVWAPDRTSVEVVLESQTLPLQSEDNGYFSGLIKPLKAGELYRYLLDGEGPYPDPVSRYQPEGPHGPSMVVDPAAYVWNDGDWNGIRLKGQVIYEMHVGTFTPEGTWEAATERLPEIADVGVTCLEVLPVSEFPGEFGWGYDGVNIFAPTRLYGTPDDFRTFVDAAHALGIGVILDVVYNHLGPDGNYLGHFSKDYFAKRLKTDWGAAINFDGPNSGPVREFYLTNAAHWIDEYHLDGLRLDATQNIYDDALPLKHILTDIGRVVRTAAGTRSTIIINENESQHSELVRPLEQGGYGLDALWNDDYHHTARVALTGRAEAYCHDYRGTAQEFISIAKYGYLYQGQYYAWQKQRRGRPGLDLPPKAFMNFLQNHDQIANSGRGLRAHQTGSPARYRALHALTLLLPGTPMLFQGQEFAASTPFLYFADHNAELARLVDLGRKEFLIQFASLNDPLVTPNLAVPHDRSTFERCKLDWSERDTHAADYNLTKDLLALRKSDPAFRSQAIRGVDGAVLSEHAFVLRYFEPDGQDRLLIVNLGRELPWATCPEPLLAPPSGQMWAMVLSTESPRYGGSGAVMPETARGWYFPGETAVVLSPEPFRPTPGVPHE
ncbi:malto-oligosyltrehalose trehalohydrolase [soil metagenome]